MRGYFWRQFFHVFSVFFSFSDEAGGAIRGDIAFLSAGYVIVIVYITIMLGKFNCLEQRVRKNINLYQYSSNLIFVKALNKQPRTFEFMYKSAMSITTYKWNLSKLQSYLDVHHSLSKFQILSSWNVILILSIHLIADFSCSLQTKRQQFLFLTENILQNKSFIY